MENKDYQVTEAIVQYLFAFDLSGACDEALIEIMMMQLEMPKQKAKSLFEQALLIWQNCATLDEEIKAHSLDYDFTRIGSVEKSVLRYALFALKKNEATPTIIFKEAMRVAKKFSSPRSAKYINAILDDALSTKPAS